MLLIETIILENQVVGKLEDGKFRVLSFSIKQESIIKRVRKGHTPESIISEFLIIARKDKERFYLPGRVLRKIVDNEEVILFPYLVYEGKRFE